MRRFFIIADVAHLRGADRDTHLRNLMCALARAWAAYHQADITFGYRLYDSTSNDYLLSSHLQRVAAELGLPTGMHSPSASDLSRENLPQLLQLIDKATNDTFTQSLKLRARRASRSGEIPVQALKQALQATLGSSYLQKLADTNSSMSSGANENTEALLLLVTPALGSISDATVFFGSESLQTCGSDGVSSILLEKLEPKLWETCANMQARVVWLTGDVGSITATECIQPTTDLLSSASLALQKHCPRSTVLSMNDAAASSLQPAAFASLLGLQADGEVQASSETAEATAKQNFHWPIDDISSSSFKALVAALDLPFGSRATNEGRRKLKVKGRRGHRQAPSKSGTATEDNDGTRNGRGLKLIARARSGALMVRAAHGGGRTNPGTSEAMLGASSHELCEDVEPMSLEESVEKVVNGVAALVSSLADDDDNGPAGPSAAAGAATTVRSLVSTAFAAVLAHEAATQGPDANPETRMNLEDVRVALMARCGLPAEDLKAVHASCSAAERPTFAWKCASQILLRLSIAAYGCGAGTRLPTPTFMAVEALMQMLAATMRPIPTGGQRFFSDVVRPMFGTVLGSDVRRLEIALWGDDGADMEDDDGTLATLRARQASMEVSGETPGTIGNRAAAMPAEPSHGTLHVRPRGTASEGPPAVGGVAPPVAQHRVLGQLTTAAASYGGERSQSVRSADNSEINGGGGGGSSRATAATAGTRRNNMLPAAKFMDRRYNNSRQYQMHVRVTGVQNGRGKQPTAATNAPGLNERTCQPQKQQETRSRNGVAAAIPATPQDNAKACNAPPGDDKAAGNDKLLASPAVVVNPFNHADPDAIPNTTPRAFELNPAEKNAAGVAIEEREGNVPMRQLRFEDAIDGGAPGLNRGAGMLPSSQTLADDADPAGSGVTGAVLREKSSWFNAAVVRRGQRAMPAARVPAPQIQQRMESDAPLDVLLGNQKEAVPVVEIAAADAPAHLQDDVAETSHKQGAPETMEEHSAEKEMAPHELHAHQTAPPAVPVPARANRASSRQPQQRWGGQGAKDLPGARKAAASAGAAHIAKRAHPVARRATRSLTRQSAGTALNADQDQPAIDSPPRPPKALQAVMPGKKRGRSRSRQGQSEDVDGGSKRQAPITRTQRRAAAAAAKHELQGNDGALQPFLAETEPEDKMNDAGAALAQIDTEMEVDAQNFRPIREKCREAEHASPGEEHRLKPGGGEKIDATSAPEAAIATAYAAIFDSVDDADKVAARAMDMAPPCLLTEREQQERGQQQTVGLQNVVVERGNASSSPPAVTPRPAPSSRALLGGNKRPLSLLHSTGGKTPATKRGRLAALMSTGKPRPRAASPPRKASVPHIEDVSSPAKPSPYTEDFALAASPLKGGGKRGKKAAGAAGRGANAGAAAGKRKSRQPRLTKLPSLSPVAKDDGSNSDDEDLQILQRAARGELSPPQHGDPALPTSPTKSTQSQGADHDPTPTPVAQPQEKDGSLAKADEEEAEQAKNRHAAAKNDQDQTVAAAAPAAPAPAATASVLQASEDDSVDQQRTHEHDATKAIIDHNVNNNLSKHDPTSSETQGQRQQTGTKHQQLRMTNAPNVKAASVADAADAGSPLRQSSLPAGVPAVGSDIVFASKILPILPILQLTCKITNVMNATALPCGGWEASVEAQPLPAEQGVMSLRLVLQSSKQLPVGAELLEPLQWVILPPSVSPSSANGGAMGGPLPLPAKAPPSETMRHDKAVHQRDHHHRRADIYIQHDGPAAADNEQQLPRSLQMQRAADSFESVGVLPFTAEMKRVQAPSSGGRQPFTVRRNVVCQLNLDQALEGSENLLLRHPWPRSRTPSVDRSTRSHKKRAESPFLNAMVSPMALDVATRGLGNMYSLSGGKIVQPAKVSTLTRSTPGMA